MKKTIGMLTLVFVLFACFALAQQQGQRQGQGAGPGAGFGGAMGEIQRFAFTEEGQKDLGLTADDVTKLREALRPATPAGGGNQNATPEERRAAAEKAAEETAKKVAGVLSKHQMELVEIRAFQLGGYAGLSGRYAQAALKVTDAQKAKIAEIARENRTAQGPGAGIGQANMTPEERRARTEENRKVLGEKFKEVLTAEQKTKADELLKEIPAYIKEIQDRPVGIGAGGQGGGNRGGAGAPGAGAGNRGTGAGTGGNRGTGGGAGGGNRANRLQ